MLNIKVVSWSLGIFAAISFVLCVIYGLIAPPRLHMAAEVVAIRPSGTMPGPRSSMAA